MPRHMDFPLLPSSRWPRNRWLSSWFDEDDWLLTKTKYSGLTVSEDESFVYTEAALPGVDPEKIEVIFDKGTLSVSGSTEEETKDQKKYYRKASRSFAYRVDLPDSVDVSQVPDVTYKDGMLYAKFKKTKETPQIKKIAIKRG